MNVNASLINTINSNFRQRITRFASHVSRQGDSFAPESSSKEIAGLIEQLYDSRDPQQPLGQAVWYAEQPLFKKIRALSTRALPGVLSYLYQHRDDQSGRFMPAITLSAAIDHDLPQPCGEKIVPESHRGRMDLVIRDHLLWGLREGYLELKPAQRFELEQQWQKLEDQRSEEELNSSHHSYINWH
jgi:hypothetical protein